MEYLCIAAGIAVTALLIKLILIKKSAREISEKLTETLSTDTNTLIGISSSDKDMRSLAATLNSQLSVLRKKQIEYERGDTELKQAITGISHDLRTPLTAICGYLDLAKQTDDKEKLKKYLDVIEERSAAMKMLTEELFRYSVVMSEDTPEISEVCINKVLEDSIMGYYGVLTKKGIDLKTDMTSERVVRLLDERSLARIFSNLLSNAVKYSDGDLLITLSKSGEATFSNKAAGLSAVALESLFDRFYTVETASGSTGLGLSIAKTLAERMGGSISYGYENERLAFTVKLPE